MNDILESTDALHETPGQTLKAAREARHISISEVAQRLLLGKKTIAAIEEDDYSRIPAQVYAEGYLKAYANFLQIPVDAILKNFRSLNIYSKPEIKTETKIQSPTNSWQKLPGLLKKYSRGRIILSIFAILILVALVFFIGKHFGKNTEITNIPSAPDHAINEDAQSISDNQMPIITTGISGNEDVVAPTIEITPKQKPDAKKTEKQNSLMLDIPSTEVKSSAVDEEPNLILTKPKNLNTQ
ncbi:MAG: hypothetical protein ACD_21C00204G0007 [uncultured bacterium]|nr:MAG: hypothetical protein ACD_21C00204G0007 [uncultured bacterium]